MAQICAAASPGSDIRANARAVFLSTRGVLVQQSVGAPAKDAVQLAIRHGLPPPGMREGHTAGRLGASLRALSFKRRHPIHHGRRTLRSRNSGEGRCGPAPAGGRTPGGACARSAQREHAGRVATYFTRGTRTICKINGIDLLGIDQVDVVPKGSNARATLPAVATAALRKLGGNLAVARVPRKESQRAAYCGVFARGISKVNGAP